MKTQNMRILVIDDEEFLLPAYESYLKTIDSTMELHFAGDHLAGEQQVGELSLDLILLDYHLGLDEIVGDLEPLDYLKKRFPETMIVMVSGEDRHAVIKRAIDSGAAGYILKKNTGSKVFQDAIEKILQGEIYIPEDYLDPVDDEVCKGLTDRQREILNMVAQGKVNKTIARELNISPETVKSHLTHVYRVLDVKNRSEAVFAAASLGFQIGKMRVRR